MKPKKLTKFARALRKRSTDPERILWYYLRSRQLDGLKFRRQEPIGRYIVDFVCYSKRIIIELDGAQHMKRKNMIKDMKRDAWFNSQGFTVLRFWNYELWEDLDSVCEKIYDCCVTTNSSMSLKGEIDNIIK